MKRIDLFIHPARLSTVREELKELGIQSLRIRPSTTIGRTPSVKLIYRGVEMADAEAPGLELTLVVTDEQLRPVLSALKAHALEAEILVSSLEESFRVSAQLVRPILTSVS